MNRSISKGTYTVVKFLMLVSITWFTSCSHYMVSEVVSSNVTSITGVTNNSDYISASRGYSAGDRSGKIQNQPKNETNFVDYNLSQTCGRSSELKATTEAIRTYFTFNNHNNYYGYGNEGVETEIDKMCVIITTFDGRTIKGDLELIDDDFLLVKSSISPTQPNPVPRLIDRSEIKAIRMNASVNLFSMMSQGIGDTKLDRIEFGNGTMIDCLVLEICASTIHYFDTENLRRQSMPNSSITAVHIKDDLINARPVNMAANLP